MNYYSTNQSAPAATLQEAVVKGLAPDRGLYMPEEIPLLPAGFFSEIVHSGVTDIARSVARALFGDDIPHDELARIVTDALNFEIPLVRVEEGLYALELFHGPTFAFKDVGARFMARMLSYFVQQQAGRGNCPGGHVGRHRGASQRFSGSGGDPGFVLYLGKSDIRSSSPHLAEHRCS